MARRRASVPPFSAELVEGGGAAPDRSLLEEHSDEWSVARMAVVDRTPRVGIHELCDRPDVPPSVAIGEAVEAATALSSEGAPRFVNGILGRIASELRPAATEEGGIRPGSPSAARRGRAR